MVKVTAEPVLLFPPFSNVGVTVIVADWVTADVFIAVKLAIVPVPLAPNPIEVLVFVHA